MTMRDGLIYALGRYLERYPSESFAALRMIDVLLREPTCFERTAVEGHFTGSAWIIDPQRTSVLLTHHRKLDKWLQLGGHADGDPDILRVAMREATEESGIHDLQPLGTEIFDVDIHTIPARGTEPEHFHYDVRFAFLAGTTAHIVSEESHDLAWVPVRSLASFTTEESMLRMARKHERLLTDNSN